MLMLMKGGAVRPTVAEARSLPIHLWKRYLAFLSDHQRHEGERVDNRALEAIIHSLPEAP